MLMLMYRSDAVALLPHSTLSDLCFQSAVKNQKLGVTGFLVEYEDTFIQVLEGDPVVVDTLYNQIASDPRHQNVTLLIYELVDDERSFDFWAMNFGPLKNASFWNGEFKDFQHPRDFRRHSYHPEFALRVLSRAYAYARVMAEADSVIGDFVKGKLPAFGAAPRKVEPSTLERSMQTHDSKAFSG